MIRTKRWCVYNTRRGAIFALKRVMFTSRSRDSAVGIATGYGLDDRGVLGSSPGRVKNFLHVVQTGSGVHPTSNPMGTGGSFPGGKAAGA
jgi:hypothetical protein